MTLTRVALLPVRVQSGIAGGARWTLFPWTSYWRGTHEPKLQAALAALGGGDIRGWSCWDLGAHFGLYSIGLAMRVGPTGQVAAFEPNPLSYRRLARHARMNKLPWLKLYEAAVSDQSGTAEFYTYGDLGSNVTHLPFDGETRQASCQPVIVRTVPLDQLVQSGEIRPPQLVKIDVEGHAHRALLGMQLTLRAHRPIIVCAFHSAQELDGVVDLIAPLDYDRREIDRDCKGPESNHDLLFTPRA